MRTSNWIARTSNWIACANWIGPDATAAHIANALDHLRAVAAGDEAGQAIFGVFEDDLMLLCDPGAIRSRIADALRAAPATADLLYLEACFEDCEGRGFSSAAPHWARTAGASCSAAILLTRRGARRVAAALARRVFRGIDNIYRALTAASLLEVYVLVPHALAQDSFRGSGMQANRAEPRRYADRALPGVTHRPFAVLCDRADDELRLLLA
jgi:hypothetical protein